MKLFKNRIVLVLFLLSISLSCFGQNGSRRNSLQPVIIKGSDGVAAKALGTLEYNVPFSDGLFVVSIGAVSITVTYE